MITKKTATIAFIGILIITWLVVPFTQVDAQTTDEQKQALIGEWSGMWPGIHSDISTLIIHEIDTEKAKARCTYICPSGTYPVLADFIPGPNPKLEFKVEDRELKFVLKKNILQATVKGMIRGMYLTNSTDMEKKPKK
jgi:hypothetical protein